jgi:hypothetical protein
MIIDIPSYDGDSVDDFWEHSGKISVDVQRDDVILSANKTAMVSFAKQLLYFANNDLPNGSHVHFDSFFCQGIQGKYGFILELIES